MVNKRKQAISERLSKIFGSPNNVKKVQYCNRLRLSFPCPEEACSFQTIDLKKHLLSKYRWNQLEAKLQLNYFNVMTDYHTQLNTYKINLTAICFKCCLFFDRIDHHLARKHVDRNTDEYNSTLSSYRCNTKKVLASLQTHQHKIHSGRDLLACIKNINKTSKRPSEPSLQEESLQDEPHTSNNQQSGPSHKTFQQPRPSPKKDIEQPGTSDQTHLRGKYVAPKAARKTLLKFKKEIPTSLRKQYNIQHRDTFRYYYNEAIKVIHDFKSYKQQSSTNPVQTSK